MLGRVSAKLYSYSKPVNLPAGVEWRDAEDVLPSPLPRGVPHAVIADLVRLRAMKQELERGATDVWFIDLDSHFAKDAK